MNQEITNLTNLITEFRQTNVKDSITPESLGYLLDRITNLSSSTVEALSAENAEMLDLVTQLVTAEKVVASYRVINTMDTVNGAGQWVSMTTGTHTLRFTPTYTGVMTIYERNSASEAGSVIKQFNVTKGQTKTFEITNAKAAVGFRTYIQATFNYMLEELETVTLQSITDELIALSNDTQRIEEENISLHVCKTYPIRNTTNTISPEQWVMMPVGHHIVRVIGYTGRFGVYHEGSVLLKETAVIGPETIIEFDASVEKVGFRTWDNSTFRYVVQEVESNLASRCVEQIFPVTDISLQWSGKTLATWGDSVTAINNGNWGMPFAMECWGNMVARTLGFGMHYGRGVGSQTWRWKNGGGTATFVSDDGCYVDRDKNNTAMDNWSGTLPTNATQVTRGCGCSWDRMCKMFPADIRPTIDCVLMMYHNDVDIAASDNAELDWVEGSTADPEWAASDEYQAYGGDYNINHVSGGIASAVMKMQALLPNAVIVLCTPISGRGTTGQLKTSLRDPGMEALCDNVRNVGRILSVPVIDVYANCGINGLNRTKYISDTIHPYPLPGQNMVARAIVGGLKNIYPL